MTEQNPEDEVVDPHGRDDDTHSREDVIEHGIQGSGARLTDQNVPDDVEEPPSMSLDSPEDDDA